MSSRIYRLSDEAIKKELTWDEALYQNEIVTVKEFDYFDDALKAFENGDFDCEFDPDYYGVE